jgi:lactoylglutathione lyase
MSAPGMFTVYVGSRNGKNRIFSLNVLVFADKLIFTKVGAVIVLVSDMERSVKFYKETLELPIKTQSEDWTEFFHRDTTIALHPIKKKTKASQEDGGEKSVLIGFMVGDLDNVVTTLKKRGVTFFKAPREETFGKHTIVQDPDGHLISIAEIKSKPSEEFDLLGLLGAE